MCNLKQAELIKGKKALQSLGRCDCYEGWVLREGE